MSKNYFIRLDDACTKRNTKNWDNMEDLLDKNGIKPMVGVIPDCRDQNFMDYVYDEGFWERVNCWREKRWIIALHGYNHIFHTHCPGIYPVNNYSEFAGVPLNQQKEMISAGVSILRSHGINPRIFIAPAHTFDENTIIALKSCSDIRIISDTIANDIYLGNDGMTYIPQQSGYVRNLPFKTVTFCYHPNTMKDRDFLKLEMFLKKYRIHFANIRLEQSYRTYSRVDKFLRSLYFIKRKVLIGETNE